MKSSRPAQIIQRSIKFIRRDVWLLDNDTVHGPYLWLINTLKTIALVVRFFINNRMMERASALTYYTLLALIPILAVLLALSRGFGIQKQIEDSLINAFPGQQEALSTGFEIANKYLEFSQNQSVILGVGICLLLWVVINLLNNIESTFNLIWHVKKDRSWAQKIPYYITIILTMPIALSIMSGSQIYLQTIVLSAAFDPLTSHTLLSVIQWASYIVYPIFFTIVFKVIPNTSVEFSKALLAGIVAGLAFLIFQQLYINGQIWVAKYNAIYGSLAALPLLLLWVQMSWLIALFGVQLSFASQNTSYYNFENDIQNISPAYFHFLCVITASVIYVRHRLNLDINNPETYGKYPRVTTAQLNKMLHLPAQLLSEVLASLQQIKVISPKPDEDNKDRTVWMTEQDHETFTIGHLVKRLNDEGSHEFKFHYERIFQDEWQTLEEMEQSAFSIGSQKLLSHANIDVSKLQEDASSYLSLARTIHDAKSWFSSLYKE